MKIQNIVLIWVTALLLAGCATDTNPPQPAAPQPAAQQPAAQQPATPGVLGLQWLGNCRLWGGEATFDIRVTNRSSYLLAYWQVNIEVSDASGKFIGTAFTNGNNLAADGNEVKLFLLSGVRSCSAIKDKKVSLGSITTIERGGKQNFDAVRLFKLVVE